MRILWIGTKAPLPATDGGRLVAALTIEALVAAVADITFVAPSRETVTGTSPANRTTLVDEAALSWPRALVRSLASGRPLSIERHATHAMTTRVAELVTAERFDVVHIEQVQALPCAAAARDRGLACVLRAQNVESAVWRTAADVAQGLRAAVLRHEAGRLWRFEATALRAVEATIALSPEDAAAFRAAAPQAVIRVIRPPMPETITASGSRLEGNPSLTWIGSGGWAANDDAVRWLLEDVWPAIAARLPTARLHLFGPQVHSAPRLICHPAPIASADAFAADAILLPLRTSTGVRMRILEAWARGVPVIASPAAVAGLATRANEDVLVAESADAFAEAAARVTDSSAFRGRLVAGGRVALRTHHRPEAIAAAMLSLYEEAINRRRDPTGRRSSEPRRGAGRTTRATI
jgi:hypothetical protein